MWVSVGFLYRVVYISACSSALTVMSRKLMDSVFMSEFYFLMNAFDVINKFVKFSFPMYPYSRYS